MDTSLDATALVVVDFQVGFEDLAHWSPTGRRDNPDCERNVVALVEEWRAHGRTVIFARHDSVEAGSPLRPGTPGNALRPELTGEPDLLVTKHVNSAFCGKPDLDAWLQGRGLRSIALCGITTNHCVETTARMGANLGYDVLFVLDAMHTFDREGPSGVILTAEELALTTATNLHEEFATIVSTAELVGAGRVVGAAGAR
jgi:nicotinamidase-related amidase